MHLVTKDHLVLLEPQATLDLKERKEKLEIVALL